MKLKAKVNVSTGTIEIDLHQILKYATVTKIAGNKVKLRFDGEQEESALEYLTTCVCSIGHRVICVNDGSNIVVVGVVRSE